MKPTRSSLSLVKEGRRPTKPLDLGDDIESAVDRMERDQSVPPHMKTILGQLIQKFATVEALVEENRLLREELQGLRK
ncbi:hypothetical protein Q1695_015350 [Nippostrongylus brasiliensis]|nr:hypothetical protein Q1695_015350 [Nippostrongylus brasiliensis]